MAFGAESDFASPVFPAFHHATTRYVCSLSITTLLRTRFCRSGSALDLKGYGDVGLDFDRVPAQEVRAITPLLDGIERCRHQERMPADDLELLYLPVFANDSLQQNHAG